MESQFRALDVEIENQPLPYPYSAWRCLISCNDCSAKSNVQFHFLGLKCDNCSSYNTSQVRIIRPEDEGAPTTVIDVPTTPQPISHTGLERMRSLSVLPVLNSPPRAASTEHGNAVVVGADSGATISNANRVLAAADEAIQSASGLGDRDGVPIIDDGWESEDSADFLDEVDDEDDSEAGDDYEDDDEEDDDDDDDEFVELINLRGHI